MFPYSMFPDYDQAKQKVQSKYDYWCSTCNKVFQDNEDFPEAICDDCEMLSHRECNCGGLPGHVPDGMMCRRNN